ncbi:Cupin domain protein, RmlC-type [Spiroplasma clarkii]|uniref:Cupin 2 conserved barrel domain-containing protein n=1 Tax=Spiroplasma clarkii TaxID=2139 RepID=A0A1Y0L387_9MOLU|nr:cupin domain-containing protein [Spiroplasma clarkii]ARU92185.1 Cupin domain protein, RmlC-type [Spiroplasma clarkii]ATX71512.1 hypothetical protein SCLAR_v1c12120 [Spiroplasma clarkii]
MLKNLNLQEVIELKNLVENATGQIVSKTILESKLTNISLFAIAKNEGLSEHTSVGDALVTVLEGTAKITIADQEYHLHKEQSIVNQLKWFMLSMPLKILKCY